MANEYVAYEVAYDELHLQGISSFIYVIQAEGIRVDCSDGTFIITWLCLEAIAIQAQGNSSFNGYV